MTKVLARLSKDGIHLILHNTIRRNGEHLGALVELFGHGGQLVEVATSKYNPLSTSS